MDLRIYIGVVSLIMQVLQGQAWKFGRKRSFRYCAVSIINKRNGNNNLFPQIHLHNTNAFFEDLTGKHFYNLAYKLHFLHTDLPTLHKHKQVCFSTTILPLSIYLECSPMQCIIKKHCNNSKICCILSTTYFSGPLCI